MHELLWVTASKCLATATGTAIVLTTPDANRTFLSYLGEAHEIELSAAARNAISSSRILVVEGYMWEVNNALETLSAAAEFARSHSAMVVLTAGDVGVVQRHTSEFWKLIDDGVDMLFCNRCVCCPGGITFSMCTYSIVNCYLKERLLFVASICKLQLISHIWVRHCSL